ncbi:heavy-metal-associated domain-containing protein [Clostridium sp. MT-14]|jgi:copper chaperone CopZ|uniref:Heavy-metal-associated domain-containing protein n=1 Tax=Clostridium aromativorans TaxID=2836848 RepID=A0ABS8N1X5_9CLOT|nr:MULTISPECIES: heavy-metal-associated domain-containing protein [Clostridium]KAA8666769.1 heavy-metal-associated domain-containing protein [Clostridium sp. HV4-5-A1G]MCC9293760.1 heavy-metal-associated domain-containing protein [Clostridium aromativorans]CAB1254412.1 HMA domain-containing protein [Clostridiaceae bacterium BL-3]
MKSVLKISDMRTAEDVNKIRYCISNNEGIIAFEINKEKSEVSIVYDNYFVTKDKIIQCLEDMGYMVL